MAEKAGRGSNAVQIPHIDFSAQSAHFMHLPRSYQSVNRTPVTIEKVLDFVNNEELRNAREQCYAKVPEVACTIVNVVSPFDGRFVIKCTACI